MWLPSIVFESASRFRDRCALIFGEQLLTYGELDTAVRQHAAGLQDLGIGPGGRVAILLENSIDFVIAYYGALATGASVVTLNTLLTNREIAFLLRDSVPALLISGGRTQDAAFAVSRETAVRCLRLDDLRSNTAYVQPYPPAGNAEAVVLYTSGTTGNSKGAVLTHDNMLLNAWICASNSMFALTCNDVVLCCPPLSHATGQSCLLNPGLLAGATVVLMRQFVAAETLDVMRRCAVTVFLGVPTMYVGLVALIRPSPAAIPSLRMFISGGAPMPLAVLQEVERLFGVEVYEGYGTTETAPTACFNQPHFPRRPGTIGKPIWGVEVEVAAADIEERIERLPAGQPGEVVIRGHNVFSGYLNQPEATERAIIDGWFRTGDIGVKDEEGYLRIVDRKKDVIIRGGFNVYPREVEEVLMNHPAVSIAAVVGRPDDVFGEEVVAVLRLHDAHQSVPPEEILAWARERLAKYKYPREAHVVTSMPLNASGKILKRELADSIKRLKASVP
jgi:long-chain acyl-CoA synthetase